MNYVNSCFNFPLISLLKKNVREPAGPDVQREERDGGGEAN